MSINLSNFVDININYVDEISSKVTRPKVVLLNTETTDFTPTEEEISSLEGFINSPNWESSADKENDVLYKYVKCFFDNGGKIIHYVKVAKTSTTATKAEYKTAIDTYVSDEEIVIASTDSESNFRTVVKGLTEDYTGVKEKLFVGCELITPGTTNISTLVSSEATELEEMSNYILKLGKTAGMQMTILAYCSQIDIENSTLQDYCFTQENLEAFTANAEIITNNADFEILKESGSYNFDIELPVSTIRNYGGNTCAKKDLMNHLTKIILVQSLTSNIIRILVNKINYNQNGINLISSTIVNELNKYKRFGYLSTDKVWEKESEYDPSGKYLLISKNTHLVQGYTFTILPLSSLSSAEKQEHKLPTIYLYVADNYSIREIKINGKVF